MNTVLQMINNSNGRGRVLESLFISIVFAFFLMILSKGIQEIILIIKLYTKQRYLEICLENTDFFMKILKYIVAEYYSKYKKEDGLFEFIGTFSFEVNRKVYYPIHLKEIYGYDGKRSFQLKISKYTDNKIDKTKEIYFIDVINKKMLDINPDQISLRDLKKLTKDLNKFFINLQRFIKIKEKDDKYYLEVREHSVHLVGNYNISEYLKDKENEEFSFETMMNLLSETKILI